MASEKQTKKKEKEVVVILPVWEERILLQLRDLKAGIDAPGCWGFFGGAINPGEIPVEAARRELLEETEICSDKIYELGHEKIWDLGDLSAYSFCCRMTKPPHKIVLHEGLDFGLASLEDVISKKIYSKKMGREFPVVPTYYIEKVVRNALSVFGRNKNDFHGKHLLKA